MNVDNRKSVSYSSIVNNSNHGLVTIIILIILIIVVIIIRSPVSSCLRLPGTRTCLAVKGFGA